MRRVAAIVIVLALVVAAFAFWYIDRVLPGTTVMHGHSEFDKSRFLVLLFPTQENRVCQRAVIANLEECERDTVQVYANAGVIAVARDRFTTTPPPDSPALIERLNEALARWGDDTDWSRVEWDCEPDPQGITATLVVEDKRRALRQYVYQVDDTVMRPISMTITINPAKNLAN